VVNTNSATTNDANNNSPATQQQHPQQRPPEGRVNKVTRYQLVGSRVFAVPDSFPAQITYELTAVDEVSPPAVLPPPASTQGPPSQPGPPPRVTLGFAVRMFCNKLFDRDLLHSWSFWFFTLGLSIGHGGYIVCCFFLPAYSFERLGGGKAMAGRLITILGMSDLVGRIGGGWFADRGLVRRPLIIGFTFLAVGVATFFVTLFRSYAVTVIYVIVLGALGGTYQALLVVVCADLFGMAKVASSVGLSSFFMGLTVLPIPSILGQFSC
jgi:hypothetical protein